MATVEDKVPPLAAGDNLSREEFLRRWEQHPEIKFAELIGGIVYMPSPLYVDHSDMDSLVGSWLGWYAAYTPGTKSSNNATALMLKDSPQPDNHLRILPRAGGQTSLKGKLLRGAPELAAETCRSRAAYDLHQKKDLYEKAGVLEYVAVLLYEQEIRWHQLRKGVYHRLKPTGEGIWKSTVFPGLWLNGQALLAENMPEVLATLQDGLQTPEHADFVRQLQLKMKKAN